LPEYSAKEHVTIDTPPTFLSHAVDDKPVPIANSQRYAAALRASGVEATLLELPTGGHGLNPMPLDLAASEQGAPLWEQWQAAALERTRAQGFV
jgi:dipeptidyl aminopeptidase/acylaminoacyl peptidase